MLSYSALATRRSCQDRIPSALVGVAGSEPAASSSRSQVQPRTASTAACLAWDPERADFPAASSYQSPEQATLSWFYAINHKDKAAAVAHVEPAAAGQMNWGNGDTSTWPTFSALHYKLTRQSAMTASIY